MFKRWKLRKLREFRERWKRKGSVLTLAAPLLVAMLGMVAVSVDLGYMFVAREEAQCAADSAALAAGAYIPSDITKAESSAVRFAGYNKVAGQYVPPAAVDIDFGTWNYASKLFIESSTPGNAVRVSVRRDASHGGSIPLFFGPALGLNSFDVGASSVALTNPRDIVFVIDLSGSMNNDSEPAWATKAINDVFGPLGYPTVATSLMQDVYNDFNFGTFPGTLQYVGQPLGVAQDSFAYAELTKNSGPLTSTSISTTYRISNSDSETTRKTKAYKWIIDTQLATLMPQARPLPQSSNATSYAYWEKYLDYILKSQQVTSSSSKGRPRPSYPVTLPPNQDADNVVDFGNPYTSAFPNAGTTELNSYQNKLGYRTYVQFLMDWGDDGQPATGQYCQLSRFHANCPWHLESTEGGTFSFPPREQPTHAARRALIAAINLIKQRNLGIGDPNQMDWVSIVTFSYGTNVAITRSLTSDYDAAMAACTTLQAVGDIGSSTATENGLILARTHIAPTSEGGQGRQYTNKIVVLLTDGIPNVYQSSSSSISSYITAHPGSNWYSGTSYLPYNAALMQCMVMQLKGWNVFLVGLGLGTDYGFMDRGARTGGTANSDGQAPRSSGNPAEYESRLKAIFSDIILNPRVRLVN
ncbi:MAG: VWA domain-containing protein [Pirellulales bacterium]